MNRIEQDKARAVVDGERAKIYSERRVSLSPLQSYLTRRVFINASHYLLSIRMHRRIDADADYLGVTTGLSGGRSNAPR